MSENRETVNLGLVKAIFVGVNPPLNTKIIWYDDNPGIKIHKYYDVITSTWIPFGGSGNVTVNGVFTYVAFATSCAGADFSLNFSNAATHWALITSDTAIPQNQLIPALFSGRWTQFCSAKNGGDGNWTYVAYADDCDGSGFSDSPIQEVECGDCEYIDEIGDYITTKGYIRGNWVAVLLPDGEIELTFSNIIQGDFIQLDLYKNGAKIPNLFSSYVEIQQDDAFQAKGSPKALEISVDPGISNSIYYEDNPGVGAQFTTVINGGRIIVTPSPTNGGAISGVVRIKIGTAECRDIDPDKKCYKCKKFMAILVTENEQPRLDAQNFTGLWIPISCGCGCGSGGGDLTNIQLQIDNLIKYVNSQIDGVQIQIDFINQQIKNITAILAELENTVQQNAQQCEKKIAELTALIQEIRNELFETILELTARIEKIENQLDPRTLYQEIRVFVQNEIQVYIDTIQKQYSELSDEVRDNSGLIKELSTTVATNSTEIEKLKNDYDDLDERVRILESKQLNQINP